MMREALEEIVQAPNGYAALEALLRYIAATRKRLDVTKVTKLFEKAGGPRTREATMTLLDEFERRCEREGARKARAEMLLQLIAARFGSVPADVSARVEAADGRALHQWALRVLTATTPEEVVASADARSAQEKASHRRPATRTGKQRASSRRA